jgi:hypothetical protein
MAPTPAPRTPRPLYNPAGKTIKLAHQWPKPGALPSVQRDQLKAQERALRAQPSSPTVTAQLAAIRAQLHVLRRMVHLVH